MTEKANIIYLSGAVAAVASSIDPTISIFSYNLKPENREAERVIAVSNEGKINLVNRGVISLLMDYDSIEALADAVQKLPTFRAQLESELKA